MKLWTIQPIKFYYNLISDGEIHSSEKYADSDFNQAYKWIIKQMENRIGEKPSKNSYPIWAWYQYKNIKAKKPDLRGSGFLPKGTKGVRIEFEKPKNEVLLSDFYLWHFPLNYWYIADNEKQESEFDKLLKDSKIEFMHKEKYPLELRMIVENSWNKIFDMSYDCDYVTENFNNKKIQATFWSLKTSEITKIDFFNAK
ncbi:DUF3841 domain-containing protein [Tenacibaculum tangerinum]|uniref:DUF3841 domain-containing protein n=1 Tax=Tenacibaculum tangerinum TaxID=3038772 RepID=A0ABY8L5L9_9FLAO|nr:DUF3841 domain-containing protein [Tenacibaculum tangerinum]WGH75917.1 DUF3841 domain-containing protein [Tenacibaculum tangerinum]